MTKYLIVTHYVSNRKSISLQQWLRFITPKPTFSTVILKQCCTHGHYISYSCIISNNSTTYLAIVVLQSTTPQLIQLQLYYSLQFHNLFSYSCIIVYNSLTYSLQMYYSLQLHNLFSYSCIIVYNSTTYKLFLYYSLQLHNL